MKSKFKYYVLVWMVLVAMYNVIVFITPNKVAGLSKFDGSFWVGYIFIMLCFVIQIGVSWFAVKDDNTTRLFYNIPFITVSYVLLIVMMIAGTICMIIPKFPKWLGIIICLLVLAFEIIALIQTQVVADSVSEIDRDIKEKTFYIKGLTVHVESLLARAATSESSSDIRAVYDAMRYSDPMSVSALEPIETQIALKVNELTTNFESANADDVKRMCKEIIILINDRNNRCKLLK